MNPRTLLLRIVAIVLAASLAQPAGCRADAKPPSLSALHPLDPLGKDEIAAAAAVLREAGKVGADTRFVLLHLHEPPKKDVLGYRPGTAVPRQAFGVLYDWGSNTTSEAIVDLGARKLLSWKNVPGVQPAILPEDDHARTAAIVRADAGWRAAMTKRGIKDLDQVLIHGYPIGAYSPKNGDGARRAFVTMFSPEYGPIEDVTVLVDLTRKKVFKLEDRGGKRAQPKVDPLPREEDAEPVPPSKVSPKAARFQVRGHEVRWGHWRFRFGMHPRTGLVLYTVGYEDQGKLRPVLYRASLSEMVVPYGDPQAILWSPFDAGEYGMGVYARTSLNVGADAPADALYLSAWLHDRKGAPLEVPRAVAIYERDGDLLWRHGRSSRRARQLVLSSFARVDEYDYGFNWIFHEDGALEMQVLLSGQMVVKVVERKEDDETHEGRPSFGHLVAPHVEAPNHQHFFNFRLDLDVDGAGRNSVVELNTEALPDGPDNPQGNAFVMKETLLPRERDARRTMDLRTDRKWKVINTCAKNPLGQPTGYVLVPGENSGPHASPRSYVRRHAGFVESPLWVTPYRPDEMYAAGDYVNGGKPGEGLPKWTRANRSIEDEDIVIWYTLGVTHVPRPEEWPLMPAHRAGFKLIPAGFFARNPALEAAKGK